MSYVVIRRAAAVAALAVVASTVGMAHPGPVDAAGGSRVLAWGVNGHGQLGDGTTTSQAGPIEIAGLDEVVMVTAGDSHSLALRRDGRVLAWGDNRHGQLGDGTTTDRHAPFLIDGITDVVRIEAGGSFSLAIRANGSVWQWGARATEDPGTWLTPLLVPTIVDGLDADAIGAGVAHRLSHDVLGVSAWGYNGHGQLGDGGTTDRWDEALVPGTADTVALGGGLGHTIGLRSDGTMWAAGKNDQGQVGDATTTERHVPVGVADIDDAIDIAVGDEHALALRAGGTVVSWGAGSAGQLGYDDWTSGEPAPRLAPGPVPGLTGVASIAAGGYSSMAITDDGVWSWGFQTGIPDRTISGVPLLVAGTAGATDAAGGGQHALVLIDGVPLDAIDPGPAVPAPEHSFVAPSAIDGSGRIAVRADWTVAAGSGAIGRFEVSMSTDGAAWATVAADAVGPTLDLTLAPARTYRLRVRAIGTDDEPGPWAVAPSSRLDVTASTSRRIGYAGPWRAVRSAGYWTGAARWATRAGATARITARGHGIAWVARTGPDRGRAEVRIDGVLVATVDLYASTPGARRVVWAASWETATPRVVSIRVEGTAGRPRVDVDGFATVD